MAAACGTFRPMAISFSGSENTCSGVPSMASVPLSNTSSRSASRAASSMLWLTSSTVEPVFSR